MRFPTFARGLLVVGLVSIAGALALPAAAKAKPPQFEQVAGKPNLLMAAYELEPLGFDVSEYFVSGEAASYALKSEASSDGNWQAKPSAKAPYVTRIVVIRPRDPAKFNGTLLVEWLNVTAGQDTPADWMVAHREIMRGGYAYVAVSAQQVGVEGGTSVMGQGVPLKKADPERYARLSHPGDAYSYDIVSQVGRALKQGMAGGALDGYDTKRVLAIGESQSAAFLTTYINAVDPLARVYDGFFVHSRFGSGAAIDGVRMIGAPSSVPAYVRFREDLRVPVLTFISETDLIGARLSGYHGSRRPDDAKLRVWEVAGTAHADNYLFMGAFVDSGQKTPEELAKIFVPATDGPMGKMDTPLNEGMPHHYVAQAALDALNRWVTSGAPPASTALLQLAASDGEQAPTLMRDDLGIAQGGIRTPWVDVPTLVLSGQGDPNSFIGMLAGSGAALDKAVLDRLYPGGKDEYLADFTAALDGAIEAGHILAADREEILAIAAINYAVGAN